MARWRECVDPLRRPGAARDGTLLVAATVAVYLLTANHGPLGSATRYYEAARETLELGEWIVPHLGYVPYVEKPPLVYWLGGAARALGDHPLLASLPSLLAIIATVLATWALGRAWRGPGVGLGAAFLLLGTSFAQVMSGVLTCDPLVAACLTIAWWTWFRWHQRPSAIGHRPSAIGTDGSRTWLLLFYLAIAIGWLAKGPVALALPGVAIALYAFLAGGLAGVGSTLLAMRPWLGAGIIIAVNLPWTLAVWARDPRLIEFFYLRINLDAFVSGAYNHPEPWWYYLPILAGALAPFTLIALPLLAVGMARALGAVRLRRGGLAARTPDDGGGLYLAAIVIGGCVFLSASSAKLGTYLMPLIPAAALLVADGMARWRRTPGWATAIAAFQVLVLVLAFALVAPALIMIHGSIAAGAPLTLSGWRLAKAADLQSIDWGSVPAISAALAALLIGLIAALVAMVRDRWAIGLAAMGLGMLAALAIALPLIDRIVPTRDGSVLIAELRRRGGDDPALPASERDAVVAHKEVVHDYELPLALGRRLAVLDEARELGLGFFVQGTPPSTPLPGPGQPIDHPYRVRGENTAHPWLWTADRFSAAWRSPRRVWLLCEMSYLPTLAASGLEAHVIARARHNVLVSNRP